MWKSKILVYILIIFGLVFQVLPAYAAITGGSNTESAPQLSDMETTINLQSDKDVETSHELADAIKIVAEYGIISGYPDGSFKPSARISREEAMVMYSRAMAIAGCKRQVLLDKFRQIILDIFLPFLSKDCSTVL